MSNSREQKGIQTVSCLKLQAKSLIENISKLEALAAAATTHGEVLQTTAQQVENLLRGLEKAPTAKLLKTVRKRRHSRKTNSIKNHKPDTNTRKAVKNSKAPPQPQHGVAATAVDAPSQKSHHQLRNCHDAQRFLRTFELLRMLHLARGQDREAARRFAAKLDNLRAIWNNILLDNTPQRTRNRRIEDQWQEAFFGASEKTYYSGILKMGEFSKIRHSWDSYVVRNSNRCGSSIPCGWALPEADADPRWAQFRAL